MSSSLPDLQPDSVEHLRHRIVALEARQGSSRSLGLKLWGAVVLVVALVVVADWYAQNRELNALMKAVEARQSTHEDLEDRWGRLGADGNVGGDLAKQQAVMDVVRPQMLLATDQAEQVRVLPWHRDIADAQQAFVDFAQGNDAFMSMISTGDTEQSVDTARIDADELRTAAALPAAVPALALHDLDDRMLAYLQARDS